MGHFPSLDFKIGQVINTQYGKAKILLINRYDPRRSIEQRQAASWQAKIKVLTTGEVFWIPISRTWIFGETTPDKLVNTDTA
jgi:hypothetical protein